MTERLYYADPDLLTFTASVLECIPQEDHWLAVLDRTAFFPEGGGQGADHGMLGTAHVTDVHEKEGIVYHTIDQPVTSGQQVTGSVDGVRRLDMMQQHSGEHVFSGLVCRTFGCSNVGFHIGTDAVTMDFDTMITEEEAFAIEQRANQAIWADLPVKAWIPDKEELAATDYRSKKAIEGDVRLVQIPEIDTCACCGTHVQRTGRIGQIKLLSVTKYKKGVRVAILCGRRALEYENQMLEQLKLIGRALSGKMPEAASGVNRLLEERDRLKEQIEKLGLQVFDMLSVKEQEQRIRVISCPQLQASQLRTCADKLCEGADASVVLLPREEGFSFACSSRTMDIRPMTKALIAKFGGKGGGPADMTQGALLGGTPEEIRQAALQSMQNN